jgi:DNA-binding LytR/AlgR family response regulator
MTNSKFQLQIIQASNGVEAIDLISHHNPDILFLDIQMPEISGFDVLQQIENRNFQIIFQTAFDEYAIRAFDESACDYLLKPFSQERFNKAFDRAIQSHNQQYSLKKLQLSMHQNKLYLEKITYKKGGRLFLLKTEEILCFVSRDHYTSAFTREGEHIIDLSIAYLSEQLNPEFFCRCHRKGIVSLRHIKALGSTTDSELELDNGIKLPVSRIHRPTLMKYLSL